MIVSTTRVIGKAEKRFELFQTLGRLLQPIKSAKGCLGFDFYVDADDENSFLLLGEWESESDLEEYWQSEDFAVLRGAIHVLGVRSVQHKARVMARRNVSSGALTHARFHR